jgi:amino acid transporter
MVGGGIFAVLGLAADLGKGGTPVAFLLAGIVALVTSYSYARLSVAFPSAGGTTRFLDEAFGGGLLSGGLNVLLWESYIVMIALYAYAFGSYGASYLPTAWSAAGKHALIIAVILLFTGINALGANIVGEAEEWIVAFKLAILALFVLAGLTAIDPSRLAPSTWASSLGLVTGGMIIFVAYEGFELIANTAKDTRDPERTLPRAYGISVVLVMILYIAVSAVAVGTLSSSEIAAAQDYALAAAARPVLGAVGFLLITVAALLSTAAAINATLYGTARVSYTLAKEGELPEDLERRVWDRPVEGLFITSALALLAASFLDLSSISVAGSAGFLFIFLAVNVECYRLSDRARSSRGIALLGCVLCAAALGILLVEIGLSSPGRLVVPALLLVAAFGIEGAYRGVREKRKAEREASK